MKTFTRTRLLSLILFLLPAITFAQLNGTYVLRGKVDDDNGKPLPGVTVKIKNTNMVTTTNADGVFSITTNAKFPYTLVFTYVGFQPQEFEITSATANKLNVKLTTQTLLANEVVVTASRREEKLLKSPVAIDKLTITALKQSPGPGFYDALENVKGVQMTTTSLTMKVPNTRGFSSPNNFRFMQLVDGVDMQSATLGVPLGNAIGPTELDIASVEITPGAAAALYGTNAINGLSNLFTKDPFNYQGLSVYHRQGINHVGNDPLGASTLTEDAFRYAKAFNNKFAFKVNFSYMQGKDWQSDTRRDQNPWNLNTANPAFPELQGQYNTAYDGWNKYGDDALAGSNTVTIKGIKVDGVTRPSLTVARTGYNEVDLVDPKVANIKADATLAYKLSPTTTLSYTYRYGRLDGVFQRGNKIALRGASVQNHKVELKGKEFLVRAYESIENTGNSYNVKPLADNLDLNHASNSAWATSFTNALNAYGTAHGGLTSGNLAAATQAARAAADAGRVEPGTAQFDALKKTIIGTNNWDIKSSLIPDAPATGGAALWQRSHFYNAEAQYDLSDKIKIFDLLVGGDVRIYEIIPDGNNFVDFSRPIAERNKPLADGSFGDNVLYKKYGAFGQVTKAFFDNKLKFFGSLRWDYNPYFDPKFTPRLATVYSPTENHNFRFTFQNGYRFPSLFEALSYVNNGRVKRVGSLPFINDGLGYLNNSYTQASVAAFNAAVKAAPGSASGTDATALANRNLLQVANLPESRPEKITSFEVGYKGTFADNKVFLDVDAYANRYNGFLGQIQVFVPNGVTVGSDAAVLAMLDVNRDPTTGTSTNAASQGQSRYRVYTNAKNIYDNYGSSAGISYNFYKRYTISGNASFNKLKEQKTTDIFLTGFNTPEWSGNLSFGNREVVKNFGFNVVYKWQSNYLWESPLVTGRVPAIHTFDAQVTLRVPQYYATFKIGGTNLFNRRYYQYAGGPTLGGLYYASVTLDGLLNK
ncbi:TonB-dependent receptor [Mucilaginibacter sp. RS28]|uniref:TonB-dependent receptor n=1 Tax=Mucilaginibacter straminoryzae TaxID=2932774 RepID=A0A9X1X5U8_9SPHI|nr:TonB-dependent receptor [Mucilaginibacter straminoryzae]MCJ8210980.1 TonB-dependent receptor [Mucilaginibacter straminoryzae]